MTRKVDVFSAGCPCCEEAIAAVRAASCPSCVVRVMDMRDPAVAAEAKRLGVRSVPAVVINGQLAACCDRGGINLAELRALGLGQP